MRFIALLVLLLPLHASAQPAPGLTCMQKVEAKYLECHAGCGTMAEGEIDCIRGCAISYNIGKRECQKSALAFFEPEALISKCKSVLAEGEETNTVVCTLDGKRYSSKRECLFYCN